MIYWFVEKVVKDADVIKCESCGGNMRFSIKNNALKCDRCKQLKQIANDSDAVMRRQMTEDILKQHAQTQWAESVVFSCDNCGAHVDLDKKELMKTCPFCGSSAILKTEELCGVKPDSVIPFAVTKQSAAARFKKWISGKFYAPRRCKKSASAEGLNAVYCPAWLFSADTQSFYKGELGEDYTETVTNSDGTTSTETHTRWYKVSGNISASYRDVMIPSGKLVPERIMQQLAPYPLRDVKNYKQEYLVGRSAEHYSRDITTCFGDFGNHVYKDLCMRIKQKYGADHVGRMDIDTVYDNKHFNYTLFPNYIAHYNYGSKKYSFYINGANGKIVGRYPKSGWKILFTVLAVIAGVVGLVWLFSGGMS